MIAPLIFLDCETTGLDPDDPIWELAAIRRDPDGTCTELNVFVDHDVRSAEKLPDSFRRDHDRRYDPAAAVSPARLVGLVLDLFAAPVDYRERAHVVGAVPSFDTERVGRLIRQGGHDLPWHHHLIDVETLAVGYIVASAREYPGSRASDFVAAGMPPFDSDALSDVMGVDPGRFARHTAMGDVRWAMAIYDTVMGGK